MPSLKNAFLVLYKYEDLLSDFSPSEIGEIFMAMFDYEIRHKDTPALSEHEDRSIRIAWRIIKSDLDFYRERYNETCEKRRENGKKGGRPKKQMVPEKSKRFFEKAKKADSDSEYDSDNDNDNEEVVEYSNAPTASQIHTVHTPLSFSEVEEYCKGKNVDAEKFYRYYESAGWKIKDGRPITNWKALVDRWDQTERPKPEPAPEHKPSYELDEYEKYDIFTDPKNQNLFNQED